MRYDAISDTRVCEGSDARSGFTIRESCAASVVFTFSRLDGHRGVCTRARDRRYTTIYDDVSEASAAPAFFETGNRDRDEDGRGRAFPLPRPRRRRRRRRVYS